MYTQSNFEKEFFKKEKLPTGWPFKLMVLSIVILGLTFFIYLGMSLGYLPYLKAQVKNINADIKKLDQSIPEEEKENMLMFSSQLININTLINSQSKTSSLFDFLEKNTHKLIYYTSLNFDAAKKEVKIIGFAPSYAILTEQLEVYQSASEIKSVSLDNAQITDPKVNLVRFEIKLVFN